MAKSTRTVNRERKRKIIRYAINTLLDIQELKLNDIERVNMKNYKKLKRILKTIQNEATSDQKFLLI